MIPVRSRHDKIKYKHKGTIGVVSFSAILSAELTEKIVKSCNKIGLNDDQFLPESISIGINIDPTPEALKSQILLCADYGSDVIAIPSPVRDRTRLNELEKELGVTILNLKLGESLEEFSSRVSSEAIFMDEKDIKRPPTSYEVLQSQEKVEENVIQDTLERYKRIDERLSRGGYPILNDLLSGFVCVLGGAGPLASAQFAHRLAEHSDAFILCNANSAPGKLRYELDYGKEFSQSYIPHYSSVNMFFEQIKPPPTRVVLACNTVHKRLNDFFYDSPLNLLDIRDAVFDSRLLSDKPEVIIFGTPVTTGVDLPSGEIGIYEARRQERNAEKRENPDLKYPDREPLKTCSVEWQKEITKAIYQVKEGLLMEAKEIVLNAAKEVRKIHGNLPILLACTELPTLFSMMELSDNNFIDPAYCVSLEVKKIMEIKKTPTTAPKGAVIDAKPRSKL